MARPDIRLPASWAHWTWLSPPRRPAHERVLREASLQLLRAHPQLAEGRFRWLPVPHCRPAFARLCRLVAASSAAAQVRQCIGVHDRRRLTAHIGRHHLDRLQRRPPGAFDMNASIDLDDRFALTAQGLALFVHAHQGRGMGAWYALRLPRALSEHAQAPCLPDLPRARACVAVALHLWRSRC